VKRLHFENPEDVAPHPSHISPPSRRVSEAWITGARWAVDRLEADRADADTVGREINAIEEQAQVQKSQKPKRPTRRR
jgi:hypothetical protein